MTLVLIVVLLTVLLVPKLVSVPVVNQVGPKIWMVTHVLPVLKDVLNVLPNVGVKNVLKLPKLVIVVLVELMKFGLGLK